MLEQVGAQGTIELIVQVHEITWEGVFPTVRIT
jgi:hypothetical protein